MTQDRVFVFGSNLAGRHGKGSALEAKNRHGAVTGCGWGRYGNSYAIPTKGYKLEILPLGLIHHFVHGFLHYAAQHPHTYFDVVAIGCGLAGYRPDEIGPMFKGAGGNVILPVEFRRYV